MILDICSEPKVLEVMRIVNIFITIIKIVVPILLIFTLMLKFAKAVINDDKDNLQSAMKSAPKNIIAAVVILLVPSFAAIIVRITFPENDYDKCITVRTTGEIQKVYAGNMSKLIAKAEDAINKGDAKSANSYYNNAVNYIDNIKDEDARKTYEGKLAEIKEKIQESLKIEISSINVSDTVVTVNLSGSTKVIGYYFSSIQKTPNIDGYDWIESNDTSFKTVKVPGTYYVYAKDDKGYITEGKKVVVPETFKIIYKHEGLQPLKSSIETYLNSHNSSLDELNRKIASYNKKHGLRTRESVVVGAMAFINELESWGYYLGYGGSNEAIAKDSWGVRKSWGTGEKPFLACNPFVAWSFKNAGLNICGDWDKIRHDFTTNVRVTNKGLTEYELLLKPETYDEDVHIYRYFVGALASKSSYGDNIIPRNKGRSGDILQSFPNSGHEMLIVDKYDDDMDGKSDGYIVLQSRDIGHCYEKVPFKTTTVYDMSNVYNNTAGFSSYLRGWQQYYIPGSDYPSYLK